MKISIVVPTNRPEHFPDFIQAWSGVNGVHEVNWIVVEDNPQKTFQIDRHNVTHVAWADIDQDLQNESWIVPRRTDCIRSYGFLLAYRSKADLIITLDDDCFPENNWYLKEHLRVMEKRVPISWVRSWDELELYPRGFPYGIRKEAQVMMNHGVWSNVPDLDARTQKDHMELRTEAAKTNKVIPKGCFFPMCGMNLAFRRELLPAMYFGLQGMKQWPFDRFGDIWCGVIVKKICDHLGFAVRSGYPSVEHRRMSNVETNLKKEAPGIEAHEDFWRKIENKVLTNRTVKGCFQEIADSLRGSDDYWSKLGSAMRIWASKF